MRSWTLRVSCKVTVKPSGFTYFAWDLKCSWSHEQTKTRIYFLNNFYACIKIHGKNLEAITWLCYIKIRVIMRCVIMGLNCNRLSNVNQILYISSKHTDSSLQTLGYRTAASETCSLYQKAGHYFQMTRSCWFPLLDILFVWFDLILYIPSTIFQLCRDRSSWVEPVLSLMMNVSCSRTQHSDPGEARAHGPSVSSQALYHWAPFIGHVNWSWFVMFS